MANSWQAEPKVFGATRGRQAVEGYESDIEVSSPMTSPVSVQREWLRRLGAACSDALAGKVPPQFVSLRPRSELKSVPTNTYGWCVWVGGIPGERGITLEIWLDCWTRAPTRRVVFCLSARRQEHIERVAELVRSEFGRTRILADRDWEESHGHAQLKRPLPLSGFGRPIVELYGSGGSWSFVSLYHRERPRFTRPPSHVLIRDGTRFFSDFITAIIGARAQKQQGRDFPKEINRTAVRLHRERERSSATALSAKIRDSFVCQVCGFSFVHVYGRLGNGVAEAHHRIPLSKLNTGVRTRPDDLITVCANCHRMLHRLSGDRDDPERLRKIIATARIAR
jgi:5-methylcytosine-specific restriction endonuclease McrA